MVCNFKTIFSALMQLVCVQRIIIFHALPVILCMFADTKLHSIGVFLCTTICEA